ncbi:MAG: hypothetical protein K0Q80_367 [Microvirga sp.]|nr:hypothetical protein [Microvirga sp.]
MFLDGGEAVDPLVVRESLIVTGDEAAHLLNEARSMHCRNLAPRQESSYRHAESVHQSGPITRSKVAKASTSLKAGVRKRR